ncbi:DUF6781 family protein [Caldimonas sp. KR1-144]|uniref:DUF6781 family protein n=1 Tax=Caldimonas sp. KR1-144 TaxID=3400911 RepID=UPI003C0917C1
MSKSGIDQEALIQMFSQATAKQGEALRKAVGEATLRALQGRELTLKNIRGVVKTVTEAASMGAAQNAAVDAEALLAKAFAGMDGALLQAVEANRKALAQFVGQGIDLQEKQLKGALADLEKMEDMFFATVSKAADSAGAPVQASWGQVLEAMKLKGTAVGGQANATVEEVMAQARDAMRESRALGLKATQALLESYSALVSGVLIGMSEGLQGGGAAPAAKTSARSRSR